MLTAEEAKAIYEPKIRVELERLAEAARAKGWTASDVDDLSDEEYWWSVYVTFEKIGQPEKQAEIKLTLLEEKCREGEGDGLAFGVDVVADGGRVLGSMIPYNYSEQLWCRTAEELAERWGWFERLDLCELD